jgi:hypothetical protein
MFLLELLCCQRCSKNKTRPGIFFRRLHTVIPFFFPEILKIIVVFFFDHCDKNEGMKTRCNTKTKNMNSVHEHVIRKKNTHKKRRKRKHKLIIDYDDDISNVIFTYFAKGVWPQTEKLSQFVMRNSRLGIDIPKVLNQMIQDKSKKTFDTSKRPQLNFITEDGRQEKKRKRTENTQATKKRYRWRNQNFLALRCK